MLTLEWGVVSRSSPSLKSPKKAVQHAAHTPIPLLLGPIMLLGVLGSMVLSKASLFQSKLQLS